MRIDPKAAGMSSERLERITHHLSERYVTPGKIAGCQVTVSRRGQVAYFRSLGKMDLERDKPLRDDTIFRIYSMTKPITSIALMQLFEEGLFQLGTPLHRFIPEWRDLRVYRSGSTPNDFETEPCARPLSIRDALMHMTGVAGMGEHAVDIAYRPRAPRGRDGATLATLIEGLADFPLKFQPGTRWSYGSSTDVCARLVEILSGQPFDVFLRERILDPLGMVDTDFCVAEDARPRFAACYRRNRQKQLRLLDDPATSAYLERPSYLSGAGGLVSTSADYLRFCRMLLQGGELDGARILSRKTLELMTTNHIPNDQDLASVALGRFGETAFDGIGFGLGFAMSLGDARAQSVGASGDYYWGGMASTIFWVDPTEDLCAILMTQLVPSVTFDFRGQLKNLVYGAIDD